jgi:hypothetical protein
VHGVKDPLVLIRVGGVELNHFRADFGVLRNVGPVSLFGEDGLVVVDVHHRDFQLFNIFKPFVPISAVHKAKRVYLSVNNVNSVRNAYVEQVERLLFPVEVPGDVNFALGAVYGKFIAGITICQRKKEQLSTGVIERVKASRLPSILYHNMSPSGSKAEMKATACPMESDSITSAWRLLSALSLGGLADCSGVPITETDTRVVALRGGRPRSLARTWKNLLFV